MTPEHTKILIGIAIVVFYFCVLIGISRGDKQ